MPKRTTIPEELKNLGKWVRQARESEGLTQTELAVKARLTQARISRVEEGKVLPTLPQLMCLAKALLKPLQWFITGWYSVGEEFAHIAIQLQALGVVDLFVPEAVVPGAFQPTEQVLALAVQGLQPQPRIIEAIPAIMAWRLWAPLYLRAHIEPLGSRASIRLAWLADVALTIHRTTGFPGGCPQRWNLEAFVEEMRNAKMSWLPDDLGRPGEEAGLPPVSKRWKITYAAPLSTFRERAQHLHALREHECFSSR